MTAAAPLREVFAGTIRFERTRDMGLVKAIITVPEIYRHVTDDGAPRPEDFTPMDHPAIWYVLAWDEDECLGAWTFMPANSTCWEVHTCLLPSAYMVKGRTAVAGRQVIQWIWDNTPCQRIITNVPSYNRLALRFAERAGMVVMGVNVRSFMKNGELLDQIMLGISKPEVT